MKMIICLDLHVRRNTAAFTCLLTRQLYSFTYVLVHMQLTNHGSVLPKAVLPGNTASIHFGQTARQAEIERQTKAILFFSHKEHALFIFYSLIVILGPLELPKSYQKPSMKSLWCALNAVCIRPCPHNSILSPSLDTYVPWFVWVWVFVFVCFLWWYLVARMQDVSSLTRDRTQVHGSESARS